VGQNETGVRSYTLCGGGGLRVTGGGTQRAKRSQNCRAEGLRSKRLGGFVSPQAQRGQEHIQLPPGQLAISRREALRAGLQLPKKDDSRCLVLR
jgi:hypothetical protein